MSEQRPSKVFVHELLFATDVYDAAPVVFTSNPYLTTPIAAMRHTQHAPRAAKMALLTLCMSSAAALVMKPTSVARQPLRNVQRRPPPQMMAFLPISSIPMIGKARRTTKLSIAIDPFTEAENLPLQLLAKASAALVAVQLLATLDFPALITSYNGALASRPFTTKAAGTGITYFFSDLTAQALEGD